MSLTYDLSAHLRRRAYRGVCRWTPFSLVGTRIAGLAAVSYWLLDSRLFSGFAATAAALLSTNARPVSDTRFTFRFSKFIVSPMRLRLDGLPSSARLNPSSRTRRIDGPATSQRQKPARCRPRLLRRRMRSMQFAAQCTPRTGLSGRTRRRGREMLEPPRIKTCQMPV